MKRIKLASVGEQNIRITNPANGVIIALDPDIPLTQQQIVFRAIGVKDDYVVTLNGKEIGTAKTRLKWMPVPGRHNVAVVTETGDVLTQAVYTVREIQ